VLLFLDSHQALKVQLLRYRLSIRPEYLEGFSERHTLVWLSPAKEASFTALVPDNSRVAAPLLHTSASANRTLPLFLTFLLQNAAFPKWAMLDLNQRPPPCKGGKGGFVALPSVAEPAYLRGFPCSR
jgi:hypothetical protein